MTFNFPPSFILFTQHGEQWSENACTTCICDQGEVRCHKQACPPLRCEKVFQSVLLDFQSLILCHLRDAFLNPVCPLEGIKSFMMFGTVDKDMKDLLPRKEEEGEGPA